MKNTGKILIYGALITSCTLAACGVPKALEQHEIKVPPQSFNTVMDSVNIAKLDWRQYFADSHLVALIDTALHNNQELHILMQEISISGNEVRARKGEYLPSIGLNLGAGAERRSENTLGGKLEKTLNIREHEENPEPLGDFLGGFQARWEVDIWKKLRNARKSAYERFLASQEGRNFAITHLIGEIADLYYELIALDQQLEIVNKTIQIQSDALDVVKLQKEAARTTSLAVKKFEAEVLKTTSLKYDIQQQIVEAENQLNYLIGRYPQRVERSHSDNIVVTNEMLHAGLPAQLLSLRPDIRQAEHELAAARLDLKVAKANFYPSLSLDANVGLQAFNPKYFLRMPESVLFNIAGDMVTPLINRNGIKAAYNTANAKQLQAVYNYEQKLIGAYVEVVNQLSKVDNYKNSIRLKAQQVDVLNQSIEISNDLFRAARADYMEVLMTQRDLLESKFELVETELIYNKATVDIYKALGGGWSR